MATEPPRSFLTNYKPFKNYTHTPPLQTTDLHAPSFVCARAHTCKIKFCGIRLLQFSNSYEYFHI